MQVWIQERPLSKRRKFDIPRVLTPQELISDNSIDCVLNLTVPAAHFGISNAALEAGKHVYTEKPFATSLVEAKSLSKLQSSKGLMIGRPLIQVCGTLADRQESD